ncbi:unnamed protein product [Orchesella dallaii]|uniref:VWFA domain-containing protein n=1 Tax=Orchesella dallaii TaxID=48710 RepID=A0ABP1QNC8_9HEXA
MTIIVFLLDTSASMNQRVFLGGRPTLLDVAKSAVETFVKVRQRSIDSRGDRYMLLTFEDPPLNIKAGWKENLATFMSELKNLQANGLTTLGQALKNTFDTLNVNRMQHGIDTYGQGRSPFYLEPSIIVAITDGGQLSSNSGVQEELKMQGSSPGHELTREPFRWDQRLFGLVLRMNGQPSGERETGLVPSDLSPIDVMCEVTGGRSYCITTHRMLHQCIDSLVQKVQAGVVIHFEKYGPDPPSLAIDGVKIEEPELELIEEKNGISKPSWHISRKMIYVPRTNQKGFVGGFWPIPESFWPEPALPALPARAAHPNIKFTCHSADPLVIENFPFDKYELEPSPLTQYILARKQPTVCWQVFVTGSTKNITTGHPFGYLKASTNLTCVNLFVMPYNYPLLLPLLDDLFRIHRLKPTNDWKAQFGMYLANMPPYYAGPLKRALLRMGAGAIAQIVQEENYLSYSVLNYLKKLKNQAKGEFDRTCNDVALRVKSNEPKRTITSFKNPFDVSRHHLLDHVARLRSHFMRTTPTSILQQEALHNMPVGQMGNYQEYLKRMPTPLREIESAPVRQHMFGNPFKIDKRMIIDEADIDLIGGTSSKSKSKETNNTGAMSPTQVPVSTVNNSNRGIKRKAGPIPKDFVFTPYKYRRRNTFDDDEDSSSDGYFSSASSTPNPYSSPIGPLPSDSPLYEYPELVIPIEPNGRPVEDIPPVNNYNPESFSSSIEKLIESSTQSSPFTKSTSNGISNNFVAPKSQDDKPLKPEIKSESSVNNEKGIGVNHEINNHISGRPNVSENGLSTPVTNHLIINDTPQTIIPVVNHKSGKSKKLDTNANSERATRSPEQAEPPPMDDENTRQKNLSLRDELYLEIRRPILRLEFLLSRLTVMVGSYETRFKFVKSLVREALRFKRRQLAQVLEEQALVLEPLCKQSS